MTSIGLRPIAGRIGLATFILAFATSMGRAQDLANDPASSIQEWLSDDEALDPEAAERIRHYLEHPIDLNTAGLEELLELPLMDSAMAHTLLAERDRRGHFGSFDEVDSLLVHVPDVAAKLRPLLHVEPPPRATATPIVRARGHVIVQAFDRSDESRGLVTHGHSAAHRCIMKGSLDLGAGLRVRLATRREPSGNIALGGFQRSVFGSRLVVTAGAFGAGFASGLLLPPNGMRDVWTRVIQGPQHLGLRLLPSSSAGSTERLSGIGAEVRARSGLAAAAFRGRRTLRSRPALVYGISINASRASMRVGVLVLHTVFANELVPSSRLHAAHRFADEHLSAVSLYVSHYGARSVRSLEIAHAGPRRTALLFSMHGNVNRMLVGGITARFVQPRFPMLHGRPAIVAASDGVGEGGMAFGLRARIGEWTLRAMADAARTYWASSTATWPGTSYDFRAEISRRVRALTFALRAVDRRLRSDATTFDASGRPSRETKSGTRQQGRAQIDVKLSSRLQLRVQAQVTRVLDPERELSVGALIYQQIRWIPSRKLLLEARSASFSTTSASSRLYAHEGDVLYQPVIMQYAGDGDRHFVRFRLDATRRLTLEFKVSRQTWHDSPDSPTAYGSRRRTEFRVQTRMRMP